MSEEKGMYVKKGDNSPELDEKDVPTVEAIEDSQQGDRMPIAMDFRRMTDQVNSDPQLFSNIIKEISKAAQGGQSSVYLSFVHNTPLLENFKQEGFVVEIVKDHMGKDVARISW